MKKYLILLLSLISLSGICSADLAGFTIDSYSADYKLKEFGDLEVSENINVDFNERRHGIYRYIPYKYSSNFVTPIKNISVPGFNYVASSVGDNTVIRIGDANQFLDGKVYYYINYTVKGTVSEFLGYQELYWNILGTDRNTSVNNYNFKIELPYDLELTKDDVRTYAGKKGDRNSVDFKIEGNTISNVEPLNFGPHEGLTISIKLPQDYIVVKNYWSNEFIFLSIFIGALGLAWLAISFYFIRKLFLKYKRFRDGFSGLKVNKGKTIRNIIHYDPPKGYTAAEVAAIYNRSSDYSILSAFLYSWIKDGYVKVEEGEEVPGLFKMEKRFFFKKTDKMTKFEYDNKYIGKDYCGLVDPEGSFWDLCFFADDVNKLYSFNTDETNTLKSVVDEVYFRIITKFIPNWKEVYKLKKPVFKNIGSSNIFYEKIKSDPPESFSFLGSVLLMTRVLLLLIVLLFLFGEIIVLILAFLSVLIGVYGVYIAILSLASLGSNKKYEPINILGSRRNKYDVELISDEGISVIEHVLGFRKYLLAVENDKLKVLLSEDPTYFEKILPYAIALDIGNHWVKKCVKILDEIDYKVTRADTDSISSIDYNIGDTVSSVAYSNDHPSSGGSDSDWGSSSDRGSSSGSGGGGSSGGGGGGGGGGSW